MKKVIAICALVMMAVSALHAATIESFPPTVTYSVSGTAGDWAYDFTVTNNMAVGEPELYFFGVLMAERNIYSSPVNWNPDAQTSWRCTSIIYNNIWITPYNEIPSGGGQLSGFKLYSTSQTAQTDVNWFVYGSGGSIYSGSGYTNSASNPCFEGVATVVPEPATMSLFGLGGLLLARRRKA